MKQINLLTVGLLFLIFLSPCSQSVYGAPKVLDQNNIVYVNIKTGNDFNEGLSPQSPKRTLGKAIQMINKNGIIRLAEGEYFLDKDTIPPIEYNITLEGENMEKTILYTQYKSNTFDINPQGSVIFSNLQIELSDSSIKNKGNLEFYGCKFITHLNYNGGICNEGMCIILNCIFNSIESPTIGIINKGNLKISNTAINTSIINKYSCTISNCLLEGNTGDMCLENMEGSLEVQNSKFHGNKKGNSYLINYQNSSCILDKCFFMDNSEKSGNSLMNDGNCTVQNTVFQKNKAVNGGAIFNQGPNLIVKACDFTENTAIKDKRPCSGLGGAIYNKKGNITVKGCNFISNKAHLGGILSNNAGQCKLNFNRLLKNSALQVSGIDSSCGIDAYYNWWGSNKGPEGQNMGVVKDNNWLKLSLKADNSNLHQGSSCNMLADLYTDSEGINHQNQSTEYPPNFSVRFKASEGMISKDATMIKGVSTTTFKAEGTLKDKAQICIADSSNPHETTITEVNIVKDKNHNPNPHNYIFNKHTGQNIPFRNDLTPKKTDFSSLFDNTNLTDNSSFNNENKSNLSLDEDNEEDLDIKWIILTILIIATTITATYTIYHKKKKK